MTERNSDARNDSAGLAGRVISALASVWPSPIRARDERLGGVPGGDDYDRADARDQYMRRVLFGLGVGWGMPSLLGKDVLDIGCGHGGTSCYLASGGSRRVVGIDLNERRLSVARDLATELAETLGRELPVEFHAMDANHLDFPDASFDVTLADKGFGVVSFQVHPTLSGRVLTKLFPGADAEGTPVLDVLSTGGGAILRAQ